MTYRPVEPIDPRDAFREPVLADSESTHAAAATQAAFLLSARAGVLGQDETIEVVNDEARRSAFAVPDLERLERDRRLTVPEAYAPLGVSAAELAQEAAPDVEREMQRAVDEVFRQPTTENAAALFEAAMYSPHPLVRVAAAAGARETTRSRDLILRILAEGCASDDPDVAHLARMALARISPNHPALIPYVIPRPTYGTRDRESHTAVLTHGTWSAADSWYLPGGDFYSALADDGTIGSVHDQSFTWSGAYSHAQRLLAARDLQKWITDQGLNTPDLFGHSHGATVASLATKRGVAFDRLVLLSWPVHEAWAPDFAKVGKVIDVRVRLDWVILADGGGQRFHAAAPNLEEHVNGWFSHSAPREPDYWDAHDLWRALA